MIVDAHAHIYSPDEERYPTRENPYRPPRGTGSPEHLREEMTANGVDRVLMVQTTTFYGWDNRFVRDTMPKCKGWAAGCYTLDPKSPHSPDVLWALVERAGGRAIRTYPVDNGPEYDAPGNRALWKEARNAGIVVKVLMNNPTVAGQLQLHKVLSDFEDVPAVLDHCLAIKRGPEYQATVRKVVELAKHPNLYAQLTFLETGSAERYPFKDMHDAAKRFIDAYGVERCIWGSDFPTALWCPKTDYAGMLRLFTKELGLTKREQARILGDNAAKLYFSPRRG
ncbi:MAG: amidohydrolase family protein [Chloroflexi bacterium]|nr:amidohydrolase family protein [Chloroflexota bacterium]